MNRLWLLPSIVVVALVACGGLGAYSEILSPALGFYLFLGGVLLGALSGLVLAAASAFASATGRDWRGAAARAAAIPLLAALAVILPRALNPTPIMNDVTTDLEDSPRFAPDVAAGPGAGGPDFSEMQKAAYKEIGPLLLPEADPLVFEHALAVARGMPDWEITGVHEAQGTIYAVATSRLFKFKDDVVIRIRAAGKGSRLDVRSRSRLGRGDMGANAARILAYQRAFQAASE